MGKRSGGQLEVGWVMLVRARWVEPVGLVASDNKVRRATVELRWGDAAAQMCDVCTGSHMCWRDGGHA